MRLGAEFVILTASVCPVDCGEDSPLGNLQWGTTGDFKIVGMAQSHHFRKMLWQQCENWPGWG